ncbi:MAG: DUF5665 domain-containing protein [Patescibacteria group bacterium]
MARDLEEQIEKLTKAVEQSNRRTTLWYSFWHGIFVGLGSTVGVLIIVTLMLYVVRNLLQLGPLKNFNQFGSTLEQTLKQATGSGESSVPAVVPGPSSEPSAVKPQ